MLWYGLTDGLYFHMAENFATFLNDGAASKQLLCSDNHHPLCLNMEAGRRVIIWIKTESRSRKDVICMIYNIDCIMH